MPNSNIDVYIRLLNARRFQGGMSTASAGVRGFARELESASASSSGLAVAANAASGALYAVGAASRVAGYVVGAALTAGVTAGIQFNATMEQNHLAFRRFTSSASEAKKFTKQLWDLAKDTPFQFKDITTVARRLMAFGFSAKKSVPMLKAMGDAIALIPGGGQDEMLRLSKAMGDIQAKGRLMQQEMNQLANVGIPIRKILALGGLKLTDYQLRNIGRSGIMANTAVDAIIKGMDKWAGGAAAEYMKTFNGQLERLKDNLSQLMGTETKGLFGFMKNQLKAVNDIIDHKRKPPAFLLYLQKNGPEIVAAVGDGFNFAKRQVNAFLEEMAPMKPFLSNIVLPLAKGIGIGLVAGIVASVKILGAFAHVLGFIGKIAGPFKGVFEVLGAVIGFVFGGAILKVLASLGEAGGVFRIIGAVAGAVAAPVRLVGAAFEGLAGLIFRALNPGAITGLVNQIITKLNSLLPDFLKVGTKFGEMLRNGLIAGVKLIGGAAFKAVLAAAIGGKDFVNLIIKALNRAIPNKIPIPGAPDIPLPDNPIPMLARGGTVGRGGTAIVGEAGAELLQNRGGKAVVTPLTGRRKAGNQRGRGFAAGNTFSGVRVALNAPIYLDRQQIGRAFGEYVASTGARA